MTKCAALILALLGATFAQQPAPSGRQPAAGAAQAGAAAQQNQPAQPGAAAQQSQPGQPGAAAQQGQAGAAAPAGPRPKSQAELDALKALLPQLQSMATPAQQIDQGVQNFVTKFPDSDFKEAVYSLAMEYYRSHNDYLKMLEYGETVLKVDPNSLQALVSLAGAIPQRVKETDLDRDERLAQAETYDRRALTIADHMGTNYNGRALTPEQLAGLQKMVRANVHSSLALIAYDRKQYQQAVSEYQQALQLDEPGNSAVDYYRLAQAQEELKQYDQASASLDKAQQLGTNNSTLQSVIGVERQKIARATGKPVAAPATPAAAPQPSTAQPSAAVPHP